MAAASPPDAALQAVMQALESLYKNPDKAAKDEANRWLQDFQQTPEAWQTANSLLLAQDLPIEPRLFAAQTFRSKTTFDLEQVPQEARQSLKDTLLTALAAYSAGPRVIQTQLCLTLSALAIQLTDAEWPDVITGMTARFGNDPASVGVLLEFLTVLPEEVTTNHRIPVDNEHYKDRMRSLLGNNADEILRLLTMYIQAPGITPQIQNNIFQCLRSWLKAGEIATSSLVSTPLFQFSFDALASDNLFDVATDVVCDLIHETQEIEDNMDVIPAIVQRLIPLRQELAKASDDEDKVRGICRIFAQAGETYHALLLRHQNDFFPIVETLIECAAYHDLDIVQITFRFWYLLASGLGKRREDPSNAPFLQMYARLLDIIIGHLRFPEDEATQTAAERDEFRNFRHYMGDTLKDCCYVLGSKDCLARSLQMIEDLVATAQAAGTEVRWQDVEAPLFSMRAMGTEVRVQDQSEVIGKIIDTIPNLPVHPRMRYAGLLVISRYTEWIDLHPERIPGLLSYISSGFESEGEVAAAAGQAMSYLCQDCRRHLVPYLPQLFAFLASVGDRLDADDLITLAEGIAYIISTMSPDEARPAMLQFSQPLLQTIAAVSADPGAPRAELKKANIRIDMLERFVHVIGDQFVKTLPGDCSKTVIEAYAIMDEVLAKHGAMYWIHQASVNLFRRSLYFFGPLAEPVLPALVRRVSDLFTATGFSGYLWLIGRVVDVHGHSASGELRAALEEAYQKVSAKVLQVLEKTMPREVPDIIEDYVDVSASLLSEMPSSLVLSPIFPHAFTTAVTALTLVQPEVIGRALEFLRNIIGHDALAATLGGPSAAALGVDSNGHSQGSNASLSSPQEQTALGNAIQSTISSQGLPLVSLLLEGLVTTFPSDQIHTVVILFRILSTGFPQAITQEWITPAVEALPASAVSNVEKGKFVEKFVASVASGDLNGVKLALTDGLYKASRKSRERSRMDTRGDAGPNDR
ncbi:unnamed protein product [Sympodiomycopsis kandeliae]